MACLGGDGWIHISAVIDRVRRRFARIYAGVAINGHWQGIGLTS